MRSHVIVAGAGILGLATAAELIRRRHTVTVLENGRTQEVPVRVGVVGATWMSITSGLTAGQEVVLANVKEPLPGSATSVATNNGAFGNGNPFLAQFGNRRPNN